MKNAMSLASNWVFAPLLALTMACGGGGGGSSSTPTPTPTLQDPQGVYLGTVTSASAGALVAVAMATPQGELRYLASNGYLAVAQMGTGSGTLYSPTGQSWPLTLTGLSVAPGVSAAGRFAGAGDTGTFTFNYNPVYLRPKALAALVGNYSATGSQTTSGYPVSINVDNAGNFTGSDATGSFTGTLTQPDSTKNLYRVSFTYSGGSGATFTGLGFWSDATAVSSGLLGNIFYIQVAGGANLALGATLVYNGQRMTTARFGHTATLLANGKVLITGGAVNGPTYLKSAEIFDPATGLSTQTGSMSTERINHTATLLPNGKVLVAGGMGSNASHSTAELFDPSTGVFAATSNMNASRWSGHTATLLNNGTVLVAGGYDASRAGSLANAEIYDQATGTFALTSGGLTTPRDRHTATLLADGKVLLEEGANGVNLLNSAETFDPATKTFSATTIPNNNRIYQCATLLPGGKVLITGGSYGALDANQLFDPTSRSFTSTGGMIIGRKSHTATLLPTGKVLVLGGSDTNNQPWLSAEQYDPTTGAFSAATPLNQARSGHTATALANGKILVAGGTGTNGALASIEVY